MCSVHANISAVLGQEGAQFIISWPWSHPHICRYDEIDWRACPCTAQPIISSSKPAAVLTQTLTHSATVFEDYFPSPKKKKKGFSIKVFPSYVHFFVFSCFIICPNFLVVSKFMHNIKPQSLNHPFSSYAKLWLTEISGKHLTTSRESSQFSIVNNLNGCLKGWSRRETAAATLCFFQRPAKCAWLCGEKGNNFLKKWWSYCVELLFPVLLEGNSCFLLFHF